MTLESFGGKLTEFALAKKLDSLALKACVDTKATAAIVEANMADGIAAGVNSTPSMFINGRPFTGAVKWEQLQQLIQFELDYQKVAKNAGDNCGCELKLPSLTGK